MQADRIATAALARKRLVAVAVFGAVGVGLSASNRFADQGLTCPWRWLTGTLCPFCGATRMGAELLGFDLAGAWAANPFILILGGLASVATLSWIVAALGGPSIRLPGRMSQQNTWYWAVGVAAAVFMVVRNLG